jgi:hypothetical protein
MKAILGKQLHGPVKAGNSVIVTALPIPAAGVGEQFQQRARMILPDPPLTPAEFQAVPLVAAAALSASRCGLRGLGSLIRQYRVLLYWISQNMAYVRQLCDNKTEFAKWACR